MDEERMVEVLVTHEAYEEIAKYKKEFTTRVKEFDKKDIFGMVLSMSVGEFMSYLALMHIQNEKE